jgi:hypothetical protein
MGRLFLEFLHKLFTAVLGVGLGMAAVWSGTARIITRMRGLSGRPAPASLSWSVLCYIPSC